MRDNACEANVRIRIASPRLPTGSCRTDHTNESVFKPFEQEPEQSSGYYSKDQRWHCLHFQCVDELIELDVGHTSGNAAKSMPEDLCSSLFPLNSSTSQHLNFLFPFLISNF